MIRFIGKNRERTHDKEWRTVRQGGDPTRGVKNTLIRWVGCNE